MCNRRKKEDREEGGKCVRKEEVCREKGKGWRRCKVCRGSVEEERWV